MIGCSPVAGALYIAFRIGRPAIGALLALALVLIVPGFAFLTVRVSLFRRKLVCFLRQLLGGNYEAGVRPSERIKDEVSALEDLVNKLADQLRTYDALRAERVATSARALDLLLWEVSCPVIAADIPKTALRLNSAAREMLAVEQETYSFEAMKNQTENTPLMQALDRVCGERKVAENLDVGIRLPGREQTTELAARFVPVKSRDETVNLVFIFLS